MTIEPPSPETTGRHAVALAELTAADVEATLRIATALSRAGRRMDLSGLDDEIGRLCAGVIDLPVEVGNTMRARLIGILDALDRLAASVTATATTQE
jgi:hypothetical protein